MSDENSSSEEAGGSLLLGPAGAGLRWIGSTTFGWVLLLAVVVHQGLMQGGRRDVFTATVAAAGLLIPVWLVIWGGQTIGVSRGVLCSSGQMSLLTMLVVGLLELLVAFFLFKGIFRAMLLLSRASDELLDSLLSIGASIVPILLGTFLHVGNASLISCLYP